MVIDLTISPASIPLDFRGQSDLIRSLWFGNALKDRAFLHSVLCVSAVHSHIIGQGSYVDIIYYRARAVEAINANLSKSSVGLTDSNIGAVFSLLCVEESMLLPYFDGQDQGSESVDDQRMIHLNGLRRMIHLRGGWHGLKTNRCLQAFILW